MLRSPLHRRPGRDALRVTGGRVARRAFSLEQLESRLVPVVGPHGLAPEVGRGGDLDGIVMIEQGSGYGTGALLNSGRHILTAAHVVDGAGGGKSITFQMTRGGNDIDITLNLPAGSALLNSSWVTGGPANQGNDIALLTLVDQVQQQASRHLVAPFGAQRYGFYAGDVTGEVVTMVGYGRTGTGAAGNHVDEVQRVSAAGSFRLSLGGQTTALIAANATAAQLQAALASLPSIGVNNVEVSDRGLPAGTWDVRFLRGQGNRDVPLMGTVGPAQVTELFAGGNPEMTRVKREGRNTIDHVDGQFLSYDFDSGQSAHNTWGGASWYDSGMERGDSGSPLLVESGGAYGIAGVFSWIGTGGDKDWNNYATPDGSFGSTGTYIGTQSHMAGFLAPGLAADYDLVLDMRQQVLGLDDIKERLTIHAWRDGGDLVLSVFGSSDWSLNGEYYRAPVTGPGGRILSLTLRGADDDETFVIDEGLGLGSITVDGRGGEDTLHLDGPLRSEWRVTGVNAGTVSTSKLAFLSIENLRGGDGTDAVTFASAGRVTGSVDGGGGYDELNYSAFGSPVTTRVGSAPYGSGDGTFGPPLFSYAFNGTTTGVGGTFFAFEAVIGGGGIDTLAYEGGAAWWSLSGRDSGNVNGFYFSSMENLGGDRWEDRFVLGPGGSVTGRIDGGDAWDTIDYSSYGQAVTVDLAAGSAPGVASFVNIEGFVGSGRSDTLVGGHGENFWDITGPSEGNYNDTYGFLGFENLVGGSGRDIFDFGKDGFVTGLINGGGGRDWLDYRDFGRGANVNLLGKFAVGTGGVVGIENIWGSLGGFSRLLGDNLHNVLVAFGGGNYLHGLSGRDILVGGYGQNAIHGGVGDDVGIAGSTKYDHDAAALDAVLAEWARAIGYYARVANLKNGGGLTGGRGLLGGGAVVAPPPVRIITGGVAARPLMVPQSKVYGAAGFDFFVVRYISAAADMDRRRERYM